MIKNKRGQLDLEILEEPGFWILGGGAVAATLIGYIWAKKMEWVPMPFWQLLVVLVVELIAAAFFASRD